jgi:DNA-binding protein H-NS
MTLSIEDLKKLSIQELAELKENIRKAELSKEKEIVAQFYSQLKSIGISIDDIKDKKIGDLIKKKQPPAKGKQPAKYVNPDDNTKTWSGHGKKPFWFVDYLENGGDESDLLINK